MGVNYTIFSKPSYIKFDCPYCGAKDVKENFLEVNYKTDYWGDGAFVDCPNCGEEVELGDYKYD